MFRKPKSPRAETSESHLVFWLVLGCEEHFFGLGCGCEGHFVSFFSTDASFVKGPSPTPGPLGGRDLGVRGPGLRAAGRRRRRVPADHPGEAQGRAEARGGVGSRRERRGIGALHSPKCWSGSSLVAVGLDRPGAHR